MISYLSLSRFMISAALAIAFLGFIEAGPVPQVKTQTSEFYRHMLGDFEITALLDGSFQLKLESMLLNITKADVDKALDEAFIPQPVVAPVSAFLINTKEHLVLIDTGAGVLVGNCCGHIQNSIIAAGYRPEQIDYIFLTHLHLDHEGGLAPNGTRAFTNAIVRVSQAEADYWLNRENMVNTSGISKKGFDWAAEAVAPYQAADKFQPFNAAAGELVSGIEPSVRFGHTPGHTHYFVRSKGQTMVILGDILHLEAVQLPRPSVTIVFDHNTSEAIKSRTDLLNLVVEKKYLVAGMHTGFPGFAHVRRNSKNSGTFEWVPIQYQPDLTVTRTGNFSF